ncbi:hypothetical protein D4R99_03745 [bacterium]|nr:MAG: hypothetical protein D4R99_03745 [bacterium]
MKKGFHRYRSSERGAIDIALIMSIVAFLLSLGAAYFYFSFEKNYDAIDTVPYDESQTLPEKTIVPVEPVLEKEVSATSTTLMKESSVTVYIGSYGDIKKEYMDGIQSAVEKATGAQVTVLESAAALTKKTPLYDAKRQQFDADILLKGVETASLEYGAKSRFIYVFDVDMYSSSNPNLKSVWYAGTKGKNVSIVSLYGLQKKSDTDTTQAPSSLIASRLEKNALHMIGTNIGVPFSSDAKCIMFSPKTLADLDKQGTEYCSAEQATINTAFVNK